MAKGKSTGSSKISLNKKKSGKQNKKASSNKASKHYEKPYVGQGR